MQISNSVDQKTSYYKAAKPIKRLCALSLLTLWLMGKALSGQAHPPYAVKLHGDLRLIASNALNRSKALSAFQPNEDLYGIGMSKGLDQEVLVLGGKAYISGFIGLSYYVKTLEDLDLAFFASAQVPAWQTIKLPDSIKTFAEFQSFLAKVAKQQGLDPKAGFVFRLEANMIGLKWFVVAGMGNLQPSALSSFLRQRYLGGLENRPIEALGSYSENLQGIASAPSTPMHMHFITRDKNQPFVGHIDDEFFMGANAKLYLPNKSLTAD